jgi:hypothetical protein
VKALAKSPTSLKNLSRIPNAASALKIKENDLLQPYLTTSSKDNIPKTNP